MYEETEAQNNLSNLLKLTQPGSKQAWDLNLGTLATAPLPTLTALQHFVCQVLFVLMYPHRSEFCHGVSSVSMDFLALFPCSRKTPFIFRE